MGLMLSLVISYAGINEAIECLKHIIRGVVPDGEPNFEVLVEYYTRLLNKSSNSSSPGEWIKECGQGYLVLTEDKNGSLKSAAVKYYGQTRSAAILFSTKISSFGQESVEETSQANGTYGADLYTPTKTKTIISNTSESVSIGGRSRITTPQNTVNSDNSFDNEEELNAAIEDKDKLSWHYKPQSPSRKPLPEIHFHSYNADRDSTAYSEDFLRSLDGIKFRPLQRNDPSGRRRSFRKHHSSSSNESKASRDEELKMFTSLEEEEFRKMNESENIGRFGSTPNLSTRSYSRSRSREKSKERRNDRWSTEGSVDSTPEEDVDEVRPRLKEVPKLDSFIEENDNSKDTNEVTKETEEDVDFWANFGD